MLMNYKILNWFGCFVRKPDVVESLIEELQRSFSKEMNVMPVQKLLSL